jgi:hypothetical protein
MKAGRSAHQRELFFRNGSWSFVPVGWCTVLVAAASSMFVACALESDVESAQAALGPSTRGTAPAAISSVSAAQLARLTSPDPVPPPAYPTPLVEGELSVSRDAYRRALANAAGPYVEAFNFVHP